ncbi:transposase [Streptococcus pneumoniae]|nr:transposase [Streptococcus pneumoniae]VMN70538.1 transposase [Streptococcus pneumoniae]VMO73773.1 transposase [Streptococcus pneumoniae]VNF38119.1 transposase [Streptococcus pneumoniae]VNT83897.1 transposase [Streptococcus pneumoniae]
MSFIAQDFEKLDIITVLEGRTQAIIRNHFLKYDRASRPMSRQNHYYGYV